MTAKLRQVPEAVLLKNGIYKHTKILGHNNATLTLDMQSGNVSTFYVTLAASATVTTVSITNPPVVAGDEHIDLVLFIQNNTGVTFNWGTAETWRPNPPPALASAANKMDIFVLRSFDGGTTWFVSLSQSDL